MWYDIYRRVSRHQRPVVTEELVLSENHSSRTYLIPNNHRLDMATLEHRLEEMLAERQVLPAAAHILPSQQLEARASLFRRLLIKIKASRLVVHWLPRHPGLYRLARTLYHGVKAINGRS